MAARATGAEELQVLAFPSAAAWEAFLEREHATPPGVRMQIAKKGSGIETVSYAEALDVALCFGWIDGRRESYDAAYYIQRFGPRRPRSMWSRINRDKVTALVAAGRMRPAGQREVDRARADGRWDAAYEPQSTAVVPEDLQRALDASPRASEAFVGLNRVNRYAVIFRVTSAKRPETRVRRIAGFVTMLEAGDRPYP